MSEEGKKRLKDLAKQVRDKVATTGAPVLQQRGLDIVEDLAKELTGPDGLPGLKLHRDSATKFRVQRSPRNAEITVEWERDIGALALTCQKHGEPIRPCRQSALEGSSGREYIETKERREDEDMVNHPKYPVKGRTR